jgi:hypothetical protein
MSAWLELINAASARGYRVAFDEESEGWIITTPKAPRRPSVDLGTYSDQQAAWRGAALLAQQEE